MTSAMETKTVRMDVKKQNKFLRSGKELLRISWWGQSVCLYNALSVRPYVEKFQKF